MSVYYLAHRARPVLPTVHRLVTDQVQDGLEPVVGGPVTAHHHTERGLLSPLDAAAHRCVHEDHPLCGGRGRYPADRLRVDGAEIEHGRPFFRSAKDTTLAQERLLHVPGTGERRKHHLAGTRDAGRAVAPGRAHRQRLFSGVPVEIEHGEVVAAPGEMPGHRTAYVPESYEAHLHVNHLPDKAICAAEIRGPVRAPSRSKPTG